MKPIRPVRPRGLRHKAGQSIVIIALTGTLLIGGVGLAVDVGMGYLYSVAAERAAAAAALSGVIFMPDQWDSTQAVPLGSRNDAKDRAIDEAKRNGFANGDPVTGTVVTPAQVPGHGNQLRVTVSRTVPVFFMVLFGFSSYKVTRTATAAYLPPISLGQPGSQIGSALGQLGKSGFFYLRTEGWRTDRGQGDAYTPNPMGGSAGPSNDVHAISYQNGTEPRDTTVSDRGGYNFRVTIPSGGPGGVLQVYNAAFSPDGTGGSANFCDNNNSDPTLRSCSILGNNWFHEDDGGPFDFNNATNYSAMRYSLYRVNNVFIRSSDVLLSQMTVYPIDARRWNQSSAQYKVMGSPTGGPPIGTTIDQQYAGNTPTNMFVYHNWADIASYTGPQDNQRVVLRIVNLPSYMASGALVPGTYRVRVDTLDNNGAVSGSGSNATAHKGYALRVVNGDPGRTTCATCTLAGWNDMAFFTPFDAGPGGSFTMKLFQLPPEYAGLTVSIDIWDVGDISSSSGQVIINILDPNGTLASSPQGVNIYDLGTQRSNLAAGTYTVWGSAATGNTVASFVAQDTSTGQTADNRWIHLELPIPSSYNPPPGNYWWSMQYQTGAGTVAVDTVTVSVGLKGGPVHLIS
jgi:hypothetical protein